MDYIKVLDNVKKKYDAIMEKIPGNMYYTGKVNEDYSAIFSSEDMYIYDWEASFYTGIIALLYVHYKEEKYLDYLKGYMKRYTEHQKKSVEQTHHDAGFLYSLYSVPMYQFGCEEAKKLSVDMAYGLASRYMTRVRGISAFCNQFDRMPNMIIDDSMNIQLLLWAYHATNNTFFRDIYEEHLLTMSKYFVRDDYSVRHACCVNNYTGEYVSERNWCGYGIGSWWSRGNAWFIYGLTNAFESAIKKEITRELVPTLFGIVTAYLNQLDDSMIPRWDFRAPENDTKLDTSAAMIVASALYKLDNLCNSEITCMDGCGIPSKSEYSSLADKMLDSAINNHMADENPWFLLKNAKCSNDKGYAYFGDYFFVEALMRKIHGKDAPEFWV